MKNYNKYYINSNNLVSNVLQVKSVLKNRTKLCVMVKANAYGHGIKNVCKIIKDHVDFFGVATINEAKEIRSFNKSTPIIIVTIIDYRYIFWCAKNNISVTIGSLNDLQQIIKRKHKLHDLKLKIHIKINTGLNRIGIDDKDEFLQVYNTVQKESCLQLEGVFTHFATKDEDNEFINEQHKEFADYIKCLTISKIIVHCCNSYATMAKKDYHYDMVRCGINIYGVSNYQGYTFKPVLSITSQLIAIHKVKAGETVGYSRTYTAKSDSTIGVVAMGYADGFDRRLGNNFEVLINNSWAKVVGVVCMDVFMVDITHIPNCKVATTVTILGKNGDKEMTAEYYAKCLKTNNYEVLLKFSHRRMDDVII